MDLSTVFNPDFIGRLIIALFGAVGGYLAAVLVDRAKARRETRRELTWELEQSDGAVSVRKDIKEKVDVLYNKRRIDSLTLVECKVANSGNSVVKGQIVRFTFPSEVELLENYLDPVPERELRVAVASDLIRERNETIYRIGQLEREQQVCFQFVLEGQLLSSWAPQASNSEGDVAFARKGVSRIRQDQERLRPFLTASFLLVFIGLGSSLVPPFLSPILGVAYAVIFVYTAFQLAPIARIVASILANLTRDRLFNVRLSDAQGVQIGNSNQQLNNYRGALPEDGGDPSTGGYPTN
jgi:hypothetical protein